MGKVAKEPDKATQGPSEQALSRKRRSAKDVGFDRWLGKQLHAIYDPVLDEELPEGLRQLIDGFEPRDSGAAEENDGKDKK